MSTPRPLSFAVGTSLLTASLSLGVGCADKPKVEKKPDGRHVNEGPEPIDTVNEGPQREPEPVKNVNPGPEEEVAVNEGPEPEPPPIPEMVNTRPDAPEPPKRVNPGPNRPK